MQESRLVALEEVRQGSDPLATLPEATGIVSVGRQFDAQLTRIINGGSESANANERLFFWIDDKRYSASLTSLREALPAIPKAIPLPFSPTWLIGLFPLRTDLVTLIDLRPLLENDPDKAMTSLQAVSVGGEQALLIGETGRLIAFVVDRIGDIVSAPEATSASLGEELARVDMLERDGEETDPPGGNGTETAIGAIELDLAALYEDVIDKLEAWSRDA